MELTNENYYSIQANLVYMSASQFNDFLDCETQALAKAKGEYVIETTKPMLIGSYVDAYFTYDFEKFKSENPQIFKKDGTLLKDFENANEIIKAIESDQLFLDYISGKHQVIMIGEINGVKFKIKIDSLLPNAIVDLKIMASIRELIWVEKNGRYVKVDFVEAFGYDIIGAIYQEVVRQNLGKKLPFILAVATKEQGVDKMLIQIDQKYLDQALELVKEKCQRFDLIKQGVLEPNECGKCPICRANHKCSEIVSYETLFGKVRENEIYE